MASRPAVRLRGQKDMRISWRPGLGTNTPRTQPLAMWMVAGWPSTVAVQPGNQVSETIKKARPECGFRAMSISIPN